MEPGTTSLPLIENTDAGCGCGNCGCGSAEATESTTNVKETRMNIQTFSVTGLTCGHCVGAVTSELNELPGVKDVNIDLVAGGTSTVTVGSDSPVDEAAVAAALDEAGDYQLATS